MEQDDRRRLIDRLTRAMGLKDQEPDAAPMEIIEHNPEKAAEWFREHGFYVESA